MTTLRKFKSILDIHTNRDATPEEADILVLVQSSAGEWEILGSGKCDSTGTIQIPVELQSYIYPNYPVYVVAVLPWGTDFTESMTVAAGDYIRPTNFNGWVFKCLSGGVMPSEEPDWEPIIKSNSDWNIGDISLRAFKHYQPIAHGPVGGIEWELEFDPFWDNVVALLNFDGGITDDTGRIWTSSGSVGAAPDVGKFGGGLNFPTIPAYLQTSPSADFSAASNGGKITIEFFVKPDLNDSSQLKYLLCARSGASLADAWVIERGADGRIGFVFWNSSSVQQPTAASGVGNIAAPGVFTHVAFVVDVSVIRIFLNGVLASTTNITTPPGGANQTVFLGRSPVASESPRNFRGVIDEFRITKGVARYTKDFTPPTDPFPNIGPHE